MSMVNIKLLDQEFFNQHGLPQYATPESAGVDIRACLKESITIPNQLGCVGNRILIPTGFAIDLNDASCMFTLLPKSGLGHKKGFVLGNLVGVIDSDYHLEVFVSCWNTGTDVLVVQRGDFICQAILLPILKVQWNVVKTFERSVERVGGFGSTGEH